MYTPLPIYLHTISTQGWQGLIQVPLNKNMSWFDQGDFARLSLIGYDPILPVFPCTLTSHSKLRDKKRKLTPRWTLQFSNFFYRRIYGYKSLFWNKFKHFLRNAVESSLFAVVKWSCISWFTFTQKFTLSSCKPAKFWLSTNIDPPPHE